MSIIFILGNGPSLINFDLERASRVGLIFGTNRSSELCFSRKILQDYYFVNDLRFLGDPQRRKSAENKFLNSKTIRISGSESSYMLPKFSGKTKIIKIIGSFGFSTDPQVGLYHGYSIVNLAFQYTFSFKPKGIVFVGTDLNYSGEMARFYEKKPTQLPDPVRGKQIAVFKMGLLSAMNQKINIYNASKSSLLAPYTQAWNWQKI